VRPILRNEDNIRYTDSVLDLVKILPRLVKINLNPYSAESALSRDNGRKLIVSFLTVNYTNQSYCELILFFIT